MLNEDQKLAARIDRLAASLTGTYGATTFQGETAMAFESSVLDHHVNGALRVAGYTGSSDEETTKLLALIFLGVYEFASAAQQGAPEPFLDRLRQQETFSAAIDLPGILGERGHTVQAGIVAYLKHIMPKAKFPLAALTRALALETVPTELPDTYVGEGDTMRRQLEDARLGAIAASRRTIDEKQIIRHTELAARAHIGLSGTDVYESIRGDNAFTPEKGALVTLAYGTSLASARYSALPVAERPDNSVTKQFIEDRAANYAPKVAALFNEDKRHALLDAITERAAAATDIEDDATRAELRGFVARSVGLSDKGDGPAPAQPVTPPTRPDEGEKLGKRARRRQRKPKR